MWRNVITAKQLTAREISFRISLLLFTPTLLDPPVFRYNGWLCKVLATCRNRDPRSATCESGRLWRWEHRIYLEN